MPHAYSNDKLARFPQTIKNMQEGRVPVPLHAHLILSDLCNQACSFCAYRNPGYTSSELFWEESKGKGGLRRDAFHPERNYNPNRMIPTEKAEEIIDDLVEMGSKALQFTGGGEPTVHPDHVALIRRALDGGMKAALVSNGLLWGDELINEIVPRLTWARISIDSADPESYGSIRQVPDKQFHRVWENAQKAAKLKGDCTIGVGFVITRENWKEIVDATRLARDAGVDNIRLGGYFSTEGASYYDGIKDRITERLAEAKELETDSFEVFARWSEKLEELLQSAPSKPDCHVMKVIPYIAGDQNVYTCCNNAYHPRGLIGSIKNKKFSELWEEDAPDFFAKFDARKCTLCQFMTRNDVARKLVAGEVATDEGGVHSDHDYFV